MIKVKKTVKVLDLETISNDLLVGKSLICDLILALVSLGYFSIHLKRTFKVNVRLKLAFSMIN